MLLPRNDPLVRWGYLLSMVLTAVLLWNLSTIESTALWGSGLRNYLYTLSYLMLVGGAVLTLLRLIGRRIDHDMAWAVQPAHPWVGRIYAISIGAIVFVSYVVWADRTQPILNNRLGTIAPAVGLAFLYCLFIAIDASERNLARQGRWPYALDHSKRFQRTP